MAGIFGREASMMMMDDGTGSMDDGRMDARLWMDCALKQDKRRKRVGRGHGA